jgi:hypothetical protein
MSVISNNSFSQPETFTGTGNISTFPATNTQMQTLFSGQNQMMNEYNYNINLESQGFKSPFIPNFGSNANNGLQ